MNLRRSLIATGAVAVLAASGISAAVASDPPPRIAFLANGIVPADALAAGPIAGQLGAPIFTTVPDHLIESTGDALEAYNPDLVVVMGGPAAISDAVLGQVAATVGLRVVSPTPPPTTGIVRAAGEDRFQTAAAAAALLDAYEPAYLPTDRKAADSDRLDGKDSTAFLETSDAGQFEAAGSAPLLFTDEASSTLTFTDSDPHVIQSMPVTVPTSGVLVVTASTFLRNRSTNRLAVNGSVALTGPSAATGPHFVEGLTNDSGKSWQRTLSFTRTFPVIAGTHQVQHRVDAGTSPADYDVLTRSLIVQFYPDSQVG